MQAVTEISSYRNIQIDNNHCKYEGAMLSINLMLGNIP